MNEKHDDCVCIDRRRFLGSGLAAGAAAATAPAWLPTVGWAGTAGTSRDTLVVVFLRGAMDALTMIPPYGDPNLYTARPTLAIQPPGQVNGATNLNGYFGLAPAAAPLLAPYQAGKLAIVHASGLTDPSRSHFDMQKWMEYGVSSANATNVSTGWAGRYLQTIAPPGTGLLRGMALESNLTKSLAGGPACVPSSNPDNFLMPGSASTATGRRAALTAMHTGEPAPLGPAALNTFATIDLLATIDFAGYVPANGAVYPSTTFGTKLKSAAAIIKANVGVEVIQADLGGWDLHSSMGPLTGNMANLMDQLSNTLLAFYNDLSGPVLDRTTLVVMSEFGRRVAQNASGGTDHGRGGALLVMGGHVNGGQVITNWPTLAPGALHNGDLEITIDYRDVLSEVLTDRMACTSLGTVFPGWTPTFQGVTS
jgi:uncharacterized protein (DUF1501 family)